MKNNKQGFIPIVIILIVVAVVAIGGGIFYYQSKPKPAPIQETESVQQQVETSTPLASNGTPTSSQKDCGKDLNCLIDAAKTCTQAKVDITTTVDLSAMFGIPSSSQQPHMIQTQRSISEIKGITDGKCVYFSKILDVQNPSMPPEVRDAFLGKEGEMTCSYDSADLAVRLKNVQEGNTSMSFSTGDTPEQKAEKQCQNLGVQLDIE